MQGIGGAAAKVRGDGPEIGFCAGAVDANDLECGRAPERQSRPRMVNGETEAAKGPRASTARVEKSEMQPGTRFDRDQIARRRVLMGPEADRGQGPPPLLASSLWDMLKMRGRLLTLPKETPHGNF
jgi:hypothetical protein